MKSEIFDDIYFSAEDGLAETRHTFLTGNNLPAAWAGRSRFCIAETGFGTGLNMLAAWRLFEETAPAGQRLELVSIEKYPLSRDDIRQALAQWDLQPHLDRMLDCYPIRARGFHRLNLTPHVTLTLIFDDVHDALPRLRASVDAWFLDGFAPAKNPDMWNDALYAQMARLSHDGTSVATFTAAGHVRRGLAAAGFAVDRQKGYGRKRDMTAGVFAGPARTETRTASRVAIVGAGVAGLSAAWHLRRAGCEVVVYDAGGVGAGASGNSAGLINPKLTAQRTPQGDYYTSAYSYALGVVRDLPGVVLSACGSLHLETDADKARRFEAYGENLGWDAAHMRAVDEGEASGIAGVRVAAGGMAYSDALVISPRGLCAALAHGVEVRAPVQVDALTQLDADAVVLANAAGVAAFTGLPVGRVRGQVTRVQPNDASARVKTNICYGGYLTPVLADGAHMCGATFQPWDSDPEVREDDHARNIAQAVAAVPSLGVGLVALDGWTGFRAAAKDRLPVVGRHEDVFVSAAHGSHGMMSGLMAGAVLAAEICGGVLPVGADAAATLAPGRFSGR